MIKRKISTYIEDESCRQKRQRFIGSGEADSSAGENKRRMSSDDDATIIMDWEAAKFDSVNTMEEEGEWKEDGGVDGMDWYRGEKDPMEVEGVIERDVFSDRGDEDPMEEDMEWDVDHSADRNQEKKENIQHYISGITIY